MKAVLLSLCLFLWISANSQDISPLPGQNTQSRRSVGLAAGVCDFHLLDQYLSPYIFSGSMFSSRLSFQLQARRILHRVDLSYSYGHPDSEIQPRDVTENIGYLSYSLSEAIDEAHIAGNPLILSFGAGVSFFISNTNFIGADKKYSYKWEEQSWYCSNSLDLHFNGEYQTSGKNSFFLQLTLPAWSLISRPENGHIYNAENRRVIFHFLNAELQGKPAFFWEQMAIKSEIGFRQLITSNCRLNLNYQFLYASSDRPMDLKMYMNQWMLGFDFLF